MTQVGTKCSDVGYAPVLTVAECTAACNWLGIGTRDMPTQPNMHDYPSEGSDYLPFGCSFDSTAAYGYDGGGHIRIYGNDKFANTGTTQGDWTYAKMQVCQQQGASYFLARRAAQQ